MKRLLFTAAGIFGFILSMAQTVTTADSSYKTRKLSLQEINLVSSYYTQDGNNASVTGGIGSEALTNISNVIDVKYINYDRKYRKQTFTAEAGFDHYTSASSDRVDLKANSSASHKDGRFYPSVQWQRENEKTGRTVGLGSSYSIESDYKSIGINASYGIKTDDRNGEFTARGTAYFDRVGLILPVELRPGFINGEEPKDYDFTSRNSYGLSLSYEQIINQRLQVLVSAEGIYQHGYLSLPFHRVYFQDFSVHQEKLPSQRLKIPIGFRANYFAGDRVIIRSYYRFYTDDFGITSHTANLEIPVKITPFFSFSPYYRYYTQTASKFFAAYREHTTDDEFYISNYDYSGFASRFYGAGLRWAPPKGIFHNPHFAMVEVRYGHYQKNIGLKADIISLQLKFK